MKPKVRKPTEKELQEAESWSIWEKEESEFPWEYFEQETCLILEGKAVVKTLKKLSNLEQATTLYFLKDSSAPGK